MKSTVPTRLRKYQKPDNRLSLMYVALTTFFGYGSVVVAVAVYNTLPWITFLLYPIIFVSLCRSFVVLHDSGHFALFKSRFHNAISGNLMGLLNMIPHELWSFIHNLHHATVGSLDKRHINPELWTLTTGEYLAAPLWKKVLYRVARSSFSRLVLTPIGLFVVARLPLPKLNTRGKISAIVYDIVYALLIYLSIHFNFWNGLLFGYIIPLFAFNVFATIIFYLQHQFENTAWFESKDWNFYDAALASSSFLKFSPLFNWITGNVGYHHIHHLNSKIPFYYLKQAHDAVSEDIGFKEVKTIEIFRHLKGKLWDEKTGKLVPFSRAHGS